jgi:anti-sigma factor RsiW
MSTETHVLELLPAYALDCLDEAETVIVAEHLATCSSCQAEFQAYQAVTDRLGLMAPEAEPSPELKTRLLARLASTQPAAAPALSSGRSWWSWLKVGDRTGLAWGIISLSLILLLGISNLLLWQRLNSLETMNRAGGMRAAPLLGTGPAPAANGFIIIGADGQNGALIVDKLPPLQPEQQYQLWLIKDGQRTSGAVFSVDETGYDGSRIRAPLSLFEYSDFEVSIEPAGGSPAPTGAKVLGGSLN